MYFKFRHKIVLMQGKFAFRHAPFAGKLHGQAGDLGFFLVFKRQGHEKGFASFERWRDGPERKIVRFSIDVKDFTMGEPEPHQRFGITRESAIPAASLVHFARQQQS